MRERNFLRARNYSWTGLKDETFSVYSMLFINIKMEEIKRELKPNVLLNTNNNGSSLTVGIKKQSETVSTKNLNELKIDEIDDKDQKKKNCRSI